MTETQTERTTPARSILNLKTRSHKTSIDCTVYSPNGTKISFNEIELMNLKFETCHT